MPTRLIFPEDRTAFVYGAPGQPIRTPPRTGLKIFLDETATQLADIRGMSGTAIPQSTIYTGLDSLLPEFLGPEGVPRLWAQVVGGLTTTYPLMAQYSDQIANQPLLLHGEGPPSLAIDTPGSFYIDLDSSNSFVPDPVLYGPRTELGWPTGGTHLRGPQGVPTPSFEWIQNSPSFEWTMDHPLPYRPTLTLLDSAGNEIYGDVTYPPALPGRVIARFGAEESGIGIMA